MGVAAWMFVFLGGLVAIFAVLMLILDYVDQGSHFDASLVGAIFALVAGLCLVFGYELGDGKPEDHPDTGVYQAASDCLIGLEPNGFECAVWPDGTGRRIFINIRTHTPSPIKYGQWFRLERVDSGWYDVFRVDPEYLEKCTAESCPLQ